MQEAREDAIDRVVERSPDGCLHPFYQSERKKIPASEWERCWIFNFFIKLPRPFSGNCYR